MMVVLSTTLRDNFRNRSLWKRSGLFVEGVKPSELNRQAVDRDIAGDEATALRSSAGAFHPGGTVRAPAAASISAVARPTPLAAPVTSAVRPASDIDTPAALNASPRRGWPIPGPR